MANALKTQRLNQLDMEASMQFMNGHSDCVSHPPGRADALLIHRDWSFSFHILIVYLVFFYMYICVYIWIKYFWKL